MRNSANDIGLITICRTNFCPLFTESSLSQMFFIISVLKNFTNFIGKHQCWSIFRSSCSQVFFKVGVLKNFTRFTEKHLCRSLFLSLFFSLKAYNFNKKRLDKVGGLKVCNFNKKRLLHRCFPVNIAKFLRAALFIEFLR